MFVAGVIVGTFFGGALGVVAVSLASMSRSADDLAESEAWARQRGGRAPGGQPSILIAQIGHHGSGRGPSRTAHRPTPVRNCV